MSFVIFILSKVKSKRFICLLGKNDNWMIMKLERLYQHLQTLKNLSSQYIIVDNFCTRCLKWVMDVRWFDKELNEFSRD